MHVSLTFKNCVYFFSEFPTSRLEMERVAEIFDRNGDGFIDHKEYIDTLRPDREVRVEKYLKKKKIFINKLSSLY